MADVSLAAHESHSPATPKRTRSPEFIANLLMAGVVILLLGALMVMVNAMQKLPNARIGIKAQGLNPYEYKQLKTLLGERAEGNFLQADLHNYVKKLQGVSWVGQVDIRRDWQQGLMVNVVPRQPVAKFGSERLVDANGVVFKPADPSELNAQYWMQLQGEDKDAVVMMQQVKQVGDWFQPLGLKVEEVIVTPRMAWLFRFNNGLRVLVDNEDTSEKLYRLSVMLQNQLHPKLAKIQTVDLRYKNGMAITWRNAITSTDIAEAQDKKVVADTQANAQINEPQSTQAAPNTRAIANGNTHVPITTTPTAAIDNRPVISNERINHKPTNPSPSQTP